MKSEMEASESLAMGIDVPMQRRVVSILIRKMSMPHVAADVCWPWTGPVDKKGYGVINVRPRKFFAHRASAFLLSPRRFVGDDSNSIVRHLCNNPICCRPSHLAIGTHEDNMRDMVLSGRSLAGERHNCAKLSDADVAEIIRLRASGELQRVIGARFGVSQHTISRIVNRVTWKHVKTTPLTTQDQRP